MKPTEKQLNDFVKKYGYELTEFAGVNPLVSSVFLKKYAGQALIGKEDSHCVVVRITKKKNMIFFLQKIHKYLSKLERLIEDSEKKGDIRITAKIEKDELVPY